MRDFNQLSSNEFSACKYCIHVEEDFPNHYHHFDNYKNKFCLKNCEYAIKLKKQSRKKFFDKLESNWKTLFRILEEEG